MLRTGFSVPQALSDAPESTSYFAIVKGMPLSKPIQVPQYQQTMCPIFGLRLFSPEGGFSDQSRVAGALTR
jgi:hypothetical protein